MGIDRRNRFSLLPPIRPHPHPPRLRHPTISHNTYKVSYNSPFSEVTESLQTLRDTPAFASKASKPTFMMSKFQLVLDTAEMYFFGLCVPVMLLIHTSRLLASGETFSSPPVSAIMHYHSSPLVVVFLLKLVLELLSGFSQVLRIPQNYNRRHEAQPENNQGENRVLRQSSGVSDERKKELADEAEPAFPKHKTISEQSVEDKIERTLEDVCVYLSEQTGISPEMFYEEPDQSIPTFQRMADQLQTLVVLQKMQSRLKPFESADDEMESGEDALFSC